MAEVLTTCGWLALGLAVGAVVTLWIHARRLSGIVDGQRVMLARIAGIGAERERWFQDRLRDARFQAYADAQAGSVAITAPEAFIV